MATVIGITGLAGAGKDTYAEALRDSLEARGVQCRVAGFADPLRLISRGVGLNPFDRATKETKQLIPVEGRNGLPFRLQAELSRYLPLMDAADMAALGSFTLLACHKFIALGGLHISPREFMQVLGTEGGQRVRPTLWVDYQRDAWKQLAGIVLVPDFRFYHELPPLSAVFNVVRPGVGRVNAHVSEDLPDLLTRVVVPVIEGKPVTYVLNDRDQPHLQQTAALHAAMLLNDYKDSI